VNCIQNGCQQKNGQRRLSEGTKGDPRLEGGQLALVTSEGRNPSKLNAHREERGKENCVVLSNLGTDKNNWSKKGRLRKLGSTQSWGVRRNWGNERLSLPSWHRFVTALSTGGRGHSQKETHPSRKKRTREGGGLHNSMFRGGGKKASEDDKHIQPRERREARRKRECGNWEKMEKSGDNEQRKPVAFAIRKKGKNRRGGTPSLGPRNLLT